MNKKELLKLCEPKEIGKRIKIQMIHKGFSLSELARRLESSSQTLASYCTGRVLMRIDKVVQISAVLGVSTDWILTGRKGGVYGEVAAFSETEEA